MTKIPHPMMIDTMDLLQSYANEHPGAIRFIHLNHTNPAFRESDIQEQIYERGFRIAAQAERIGL
jgi:pyrroloquinoline quinone biosynthesis protein B